jgi:hypothetical protein
VVIMLNLEVSFMYIEYPVPESYKGESNENRKTEIKNSKYRAIVL